jgi:hypothetical protein
MSNGKLRNGKRIVWVVGAPKSGNTWLSRLLGDILDSPIAGALVPGRKNPSKPLAAEGANRKGGFFIQPEHMTAVSWANGCPVVYIYRDPRDIIVSAHYYWEDFSIDHMIDAVIFGRWPYAYGWRKMVDLWYAKDNADYYVSYEGLSRNPKSIIQDVLRILDAKVGDARINAAIDRQSFGKRKKTLNDALPYGVGIQNKLMRKGKIGDWKSHMNMEQRKRVHDGCYDLMELLNYEDDPEWWRIDRG